jgi:hypothetical protein
MKLIQFMAGTSNLTTLYDSILDTSFLLVLTDQGEIGNISVSTFVYMFSIMTFYKERA